MQRSATRGQAMTREDRSHWHREYSRANHTHPGVYVSFAEYQTPSNPKISAGYATVPSLIANQQTTVTVTLKIAMADTSYQSIPALTGASSVSLLASLSIQSWAVTSKSTVDVVIKNTGLLTLAGAVVLVVALHD